MQPHFAEIVLVTAAVNTGKDVDQYDTGAGSQYLVDEKLHSTKYINELEFRRMSATTLWI